MNPKHFGKHLLLLIFFSVTSIFSYADTFIVTSNADSGPGTLREAITLAAANGTGITDSILFNLPDQSRNGRSITINSSLPDLSSNLVIDGSSQTGSSFGKSDAKIIILVSIVSPSPPFSIFNCRSISNIELYGLFLFHDKFTMFSTPPTGIDGISIYDCSNITIGKPGKGNYFRGLTYAVYTKPKDSNSGYQFYCTNLTIQSNIFNNDEDGYPTLLYNNSQGTINAMIVALFLFNTSNIKIGGPTAIEGNTISSYSIEIKTNRAAGNGFLMIQNNKIGVDVSGDLTRPDKFGRTKIKIYGDYSQNPSDYTVSILNNIIDVGIEILYISKFIKIQGNTIAEVSGSGTSYNFELKAGLYSCSGGGIIGGDLPEEQNLIYTNGIVSTNNFWNNLEEGGIVISSSPNILISKNKTYCTSRYGTGIKVYGSGEPHVQIDSTGTGFVKGKATPNCKIEVFLDDDCWACDGIAFLGETISNADSSWSFSGNFNGVVIATATLNGKSTSGYTEPTYRTDNIKTLQPTCGENNGSIKGIRLIHSINNVEWHQYILRNGYYIDTLISTNIDLTGIGPGIYYFVAKLGQTCRSAAMGFQLKNYTPSIDESAISVTNPSCGLSNGIINGLKIVNGDYSKYKWVNDLGTEFTGSNFGGQPYLSNLSQGKYRLIIKDTLAGCADTSQWITLTNQSGPSLNTNGIQLAHTTCGNSNGSITGINATNVTGTAFIQWVDSLNQFIGNSFDILNLKPGKYKLKFKDQSGCDTIITPYYIITNNGAITIDTSQLLVTSSQCSYASGTIKGISVTGATVYKWLNNSGQVISNSIDPGFLYPGKYILKATNSYGCEKQTDSIIVPTYPYMAFTYILRTQIIPGRCDSLNGSVQLLNFANSQNYTFRWIDSLQPSVNIGNTLDLYRIRSGTFILFAKNAAGCEQQVLRAGVPYFAPPQLNESGLKTMNEICSNARGSIEGITNVNGKGAPPFSFSWIDAGNNITGTQQNLNNATAGNYRLIIADAAGCADTSSSIQILNTSVTLNTPLYTDQIIGTNNSATLSVKNLQQGTYYLYDQSQSAAPIDQNTTGIFTTPLLTQNKTYYIELINGTCKSIRVQIKVLVYDKTVIYVPTAFTPNNDNVNDVLKPVAYGPVKLEFFRIFNRWGQLVFSSTDLLTGWDGYFNRQIQPQSNFTWILKAKDELTGEIISQSGSFLLIR